MGVGSEAGCVEHVWVLAEVGFGPSGAELLHVCWRCSGARISLPDGSPLGCLQEA